MPDPKPIDASRGSAFSSRESFSECFDDRRKTTDEDEALYRKSSFFERAGKWFNNVGISFKRFFDSFGDGMASAWTAIKRAFGSEGQAQQAVRHIRDTSTATNSEGTPPHGQADPALGPNPLEAPLQSLEHDHLRDTPPGVASTRRGGDAALIQQEDKALAAPVDTPNSEPLESSEEKAFSIFVDEFKQAQREGRDFSGAGRQQFDAPAKRHAQKLYDAEVARLDDLGDRVGDYALGSDQALEIEVASTLLNKPLPHQKLLDLTGQTSVPSYSAQDKECFDTWMDWRETKTLPKGEAIDLASASRYANEFIAKNASNPQQAPDIKRQFEKANELIRDRDADEAAMVIQVMDASVKEAVAATSPIPLPAFPAGVTTLALQPINGGLQGHVIKKIIEDSKHYFSAIRKAEEPDELDKAQAIMFASLWKAGKSDARTLTAMKAWDFFEPLDQLLDLEKIQNNFK
jgi:hypothetical protein